MPAFDRPLWLAALALSALLAIVAAPWALAQPWLYFVFKPVTTLLVIALAWPRGRRTPVLRRWVLAGLVLSLAGDVALMTERGFVPGLVAFLLAQLAYLVAFARAQPLAARWLPFVVYGVLGAAIAAALWPHVPAALRVPVLLYVLAVVAMAAQAVVLWRLAPADAAARRLAIGGALFLASDALLAMNRFAIPLPAASLWVLATYWTAQACIASWLAPPQDGGSSSAAAGR